MEPGTRRLIVLTGATRGLGRALAEGLIAGGHVVLGCGRSAGEIEGIIDTAMLLSCFGPEAGQYPDARQWAGTAVPYLLQLGPKDNGKPLTAPG